MGESKVKELEAKMQRLEAKLEGANELIKAKDLELTEAKNTIRTLKLAQDLRKYQGRSQAEEVTQLTAELEKYTKGVNKAMQGNAKNPGAWSGTGENDPELDTLARTIKFGELIEKEGLKYKEAIEFAANAWGLTEATLRGYHPKASYLEQYHKALVDLER